MPTYYSMFGARRLKRWRYPGVPIPRRLRYVYSDNPKHW